MTKFFTAAGVISARAFSARGVVAGVAAAAALAFAGQAAAGTFLIQSSSFVNDQERGNSALRSGNFVMSPFVIEAKDVPGAVGFQSYLAFCIQLTVDMPYDPDTNGVTTLNLAYQDGSSGLSANDQKKVGQLVNYGTTLFNNAGGSVDLQLSHQLAALQGAIWTITDGPVSFFEDVYDPADPDDPGSMSEAEMLNNLIGTYLGDEVIQANAPYAVRTLYATGGQGLAVAGLAPPTGGVPEPGAWALMLTGFLGAGAALRSSRRKATATA